MTVLKKPGAKYKNNRIFDNSRQLVMGSISFFGRVPDGDFFFFVLIAIGRVLRHTWYNNFERGPNYLARSTLKTRIRSKFMMASFPKTYQGTRPGGL